MVYLTRRAFCYQVSTNIVRVWLLLLFVILLTCEHYIHCLPDADYRRTCGNRTFDEDTLQGVIYTPNYPDQYAPDTFCDYPLEGPPGTYVELNFDERFDLEESSNCMFDRVEFRDGPYGFSPIIGRYCGSKHPVVIQSTHRWLWMSFRSDSSMERGGFKVVYWFKPGKAEIAPWLPRQEIEKPQETCLFHFTNESGLVSDDQSRQRTNHTVTDVSCIWIITAPVGYRVFLRTNSFAMYLEHDDGCRGARMSVYDGSSSSEYMRGLFCERYTTDIVSHSNRLYLRLYGNGFLMTYMYKFNFTYTMFRPAPCDVQYRAEECQLRFCNQYEFYCDNMCLNVSMICNGLANCPENHDERECIPPPIEPVELRTPVVIALAITVYLVVLLFWIRDRFLLKREIKSEVVTDGGSLKWRVAPGHGGRPETNHDIEVQVHSESLESVSPPKSSLSSNIGIDISDNSGSRSHSISEV